MTLRGDATMDRWPDRPTVTIEEAAQLLGISRRLAYSAAKAGTIPTLRFGRRVVVPTIRLRRLVEDGDLSALR